MKQALLLGSLALVMAFLLDLGLGSSALYAQDVQLAQRRTFEMRIPSQPPRHKFGAIAYSESSGRWGTSYNYKSRAEAEQAALNRCREADCAVKIWFRNACGALAVGKGNCMGWAWARNRSEAERKALDWCRRNGEDCSVTCWACTDR